MHFKFGCKRRRKSTALSLKMTDVLGPLPEGLRKGVYEAYSQPSYAHFMRRTVALQEGTMSLEEVDAHVFSILGFEGGIMDRDPGYQPFRDASSKSHRPDLYRMFVKWSNGASPVVGKKKKKKWSNGASPVVGKKKKKSVLFSFKRMCLEN